MWTKDLQSVLVHFFCSFSADKKGDITIGLKQTATKIPADGAGTHNQDLHNSLPVL
jgi:hypothetical protein